MNGQNSVPELDIYENFDVLDRLGSGGMSRAYKARQRLMNRIVALKICRSTVSSGDKISTSFAQEARMISVVTHSNIGYALMAGYDRRIDRMYYAMEYIDGPSVEDVILSSGKIREREFLALAESIAEALECIHANDIIHLDIKPANLMINADGVLKIIDFGLARQASVQEPFIVGTPLYMAPEQSGVLKDSLDARTDLYAAGCTFFHMLTGQPPYKVRHRDENNAHVKGEIPRVKDFSPEVSSATDNVVFQMMQRAKNDRLSSAVNLRKQLSLINHPKLAPVGEKMQKQFKALRVRRYYRRRRA